MESSSLFRIECCVLHHFLFWIMIQCPQPVLDMWLGRGTYFFGTCNYNFSGSHLVSNTYTMIVYGNLACAPLSCRRRLEIWQSDENGTGLGATYIWYHSYTVGNKPLEWFALLQRYIYISGNKTCKFLKILQSIFYHLGYNLIWLQVPVAS